MALAHLGPAEVVDLLPFTPGSEKTAALVKTRHFELIRVVLPAGKEVAEHAIEGPMILQCLEGRLRLTARGAPLELHAGGLVHLDPGTPHALSAIEDSAALLTIIFV